MKVFKVVVKENGFLVSATAKGSAKVTYKVNEFVSAPDWLANIGYHLFAFTDFHAARGFVLDDANGIEIWEAEGEGIIRNVPPLLDPTDLKDKILTPLPFEPPIGTIMAKRIKLIRKVWPENDDRPIS